MSYKCKWEACSEEFTSSAELEGHVIREHIHKDNGWMDCNVTLVNDPIHGPIMLHPLCVKIIDTPQFQRLRRVKQLGSTYFVYPGASHNRFEHSIGVCHLAGKFVELLKANQPDLPITEKDILCVKIAGLCHDLGHGPFSHLFESIVKEIRAEKKKEESQVKTTSDEKEEREWKHEHASLELLNHLITEKKMEAEFEKWTLEGKDIKFIKSLIHKDIEKNEESDEERKRRYELTGRRKNQEFLYQIVANDTNGLDVDKWDYFARDCHMLGIKNNFDHLRCMQLARVCDVNGENQICFRDKEEFNIREMFHTRYTLHKRAYKHKTALVINVMIQDALKEANSHYKKFVGSKNEQEEQKELLTISQSVIDMKAYTNLTDDVLYDIRLSTEDTLQKSRDIIDRIIKRDLYKCLVIKTVKTKVTEKEVKNALEDALKDANPYLKDAQSDKRLLDEFEIKIAKFDYSKGNEDPVDYVRFFYKDNPTIGVQRTLNGRVKALCHWDILVIYKGPSDPAEDAEDKKTKIKNAFEKACEKGIKAETCIH